MKIITNLSAKLTQRVVMFKDKSENRIEVMRRPFFVC